ncbi:hypothetical protein [Sinorhizobium meliloti]|uniref:hypothetical protein n=1 Tax=Rhizobium meliloti TaxID=382 RepID=UPI002D78D3C8|nr:hypothetical protein [Sinorhizobium meliloti]
MRKGHQVALIEEASIGHGYSWGNGAQYNVGSTLPMTYPGVAWRALSWLTKENGPVGLAPGELLRTIPWFIHFLRTGRPKAWRAAYTALHD